MNAYVSEAPKPLTKNISISPFLFVLEVIITTFSPKSSISTTSTSVPSRLNTTTLLANTYDFPVISVLVVTVVSGSSLTIVILEILPLLFKLYLITSFSSKSSLITNSLSLVALD
ncbi:hypothetical protein DSECCO2_590520 [anaerobic digester metagenome]